MEVPMKFKKSELSNNFNRVWKILQAIISAAQFFKSLFTYESPRRSLIAFFVSKIDAAAISSRGLSSRNFPVFLFFSLAVFRGPQQQ